MTRSALLLALTSNGSAAGLRVRARAMRSVAMGDEAAARLGVLVA